MEEVLNHSYIIYRIYTHVKPSKSDHPFYHFGLPCNTYFSIDDVRNNLSAFCNIKSVGPDGIPTRRLFVQT